jgi:hypothetical protein
MAFSWRINRCRGLLPDRKHPYEIIRFRLIASLCPITYPDRIRGRGEQSGFRCGSVCVASVPLTSTRPVPAPLPQHLLSGFWPVMRSASGVQLNEKGKDVTPMFTGPRPARMRWPSGIQLNEKGKDVIPMFNLITQPKRREVMNNMAYTAGQWVAAPALSCCNSLSALRKSLSSGSSFSAVSKCATASAVRCMFASSIARL